MKNKQKIEIDNIAATMWRSGLPNSFVLAAEKLAEQYEDIYDLMTMWQDEQYEAEQNEIIADIQDLIDEKVESEWGTAEKPRVPFDKLDEIGSKVLSFKVELKKRADAFCEISQLAVLTETTITYLDRFFHSASIPKHIAFLRIVDAICMPEDEIESCWIGLMKELDPYG